MKIAAQALALSRQLKWQKGIALGYRQKGLIYYFQSDFVNAIAFSQEALKAAATINNNLLNASIYNNIANVYADMGQQEKALDYYKKLLTAAQEAKHRVYEMNALVNMGLVYLEQNNFPEALINLQKGLDIAVVENNISISAAIYNNMGVAYKNMNRMPEALQHLQKSIALAKQSNNQNAMATSFNEVAMVYILMKEYKKARQYATESLTYSIPIKAVQWQSNAYQILSNALENEGKPADALDAYKKYILLRDSVMNDEKKQEIDRKEMQFEFEKKEVLLEAENEKEVALAYAEAERQRIIRNGVGGGFAILLIAALFGYVLYKRKRDAVEQKKEAEFKARVTETEMKALRAQMNPHFIFNSLNSIADYISKNDIPAADSYLAKFAKLMRLILENSEQKEVSLTDDLKALELYVQLEAKRLNHTFTYSISIDEDIDQANTLVPPLLLQPFVENSIWHGLANKKDGKIMISITSENGMLNCVVEDNGVGRQQAAKTGEDTNTQKKSLGMKITRERIDVINQSKNANASITLHDLAEGLRAELRLPLQTAF